MNFDQETPSVNEFLRKLEMMIAFFFFFSDGMDLCFLIRIMFQEISIMSQLPVHVYLFVQP